MIGMPEDKDTPEMNSDGVIFSKRFNASIPPVLTDKRGQGGLPDVSEYTSLGVFAEQMEEYFEVADDVSGSLAFDFEPGALSADDALLQGTWNFTVRARDFAGNLSANQCSGQITVTPAPPPPAGIDFRDTERISYGKFDKGANTMQAWIWVDQNLDKSRDSMIIGYNSNQITPEGRTAVYAYNAFGLVMAASTYKLRAYWRTTNIDLDYDLRRSEWLFVSVVRNTAEGQAEFYINGELTGTAPYGSGSDWAVDIPYAAGGYTQTNDLYIGHHGTASPEAANRFAGRIAGVTLLSTARTAAEIKADMARMPEEGEPGVLFRRVFNDDAPPSVTPPAEITPVSEGMTLERFRAHIAGLYAITDNVHATAVIDLDPDALSDGGTLLPGTWDFTVAAHDFAGNAAGPVHAQITVTPVDPSLLIPEIVYSGGLTLIAAQGKSAAEIESAILAKTAVYDNNAPPPAVVAFSDGATDADGNLLAGNRTVTVNAVDRDGNSAVPVAIGLLVRDGPDFSSDYNGNPRTAKGYSIGPLETINTWSAWIRIMPDPDNNRGNATPTRYGYILGQWDGTNAASSMSFDIRPGGRPCVNWGDVMYQFTNVDVRTGEYLFLTVVRDTAAKELRCYVNGELRQTLAFSGIINTNLVPVGDFWIGRDKRPAYLDSIFMGEIASVHIFGAARTQAEIKADMLGVDSGAAGVLYSAYIVPDREPPTLTVTLGGEPCPDTLYLAAGDERVDFAVTVADNADGATDFRMAYSDGAIDIFGWLTEGTHTVTVTASDRSGNASARVITLIVGARPGGGGDRPDCGGDPCVCDSCACDNGGECTGNLCPCRPDGGGECSNDLCPCRPDDGGDGGGDGDESGDGGGGSPGCRNTGAAALFVPLLAAAVLFISRRKYS
jgi:hypothetical protein